MKVRQRVTAAIGVSKMTLTTITANNTTLKMDEDIALTRKKFNEITEESWKKCEKFMKYEEEYVKEILLTEEAVDNCIIHLGEESGE
ncbi:hypothetical protein ANN_28095 [Periplaneta americana]|uniref:Uncharacterized protein n=1 Tax=Periplaneta americana TaxID=6978 RepID=A0ABQ8RUY1_PERAM|nr:hypothetical protein ANN_28095 [Periplaneta americana]